MKSERDQQTELVGFMNKNGWVLWKLADGSLTAKPGDIIGSSPKGVATLIEAKLNLALTSDENGLKCLRSPFAPHQVTSLRRIVGSQGYALIIGFNQHSPKNPVVTFIGMLDSSSFKDEKLLRPICAYIYSRKGSDKSLQFNITKGVKFDHVSKEVVDIDTKYIPEEFYW